MSSKKKRKKLKEQYTIKEPNKMFLVDSEPVIDYFKKHPNKLISSYEIMNNTHLENDSQSSVSRTIKAINYYTNFKIESKIGGYNGGGYIYYA